MSGSAELPGGIPPRYKVEKELGRGGMGRVVAAFDTTIRRRVAIKIAPAPPPGDVEQQQAFQRFRREAQLAGGLRHENIVGIYDFGADAQSAWMVMEIVEGGSLRELLQRTETLSLAETARIMVQLLDGLAFCHDQGIVHCDVKPANIMLTEPSTAGEVKLADFGIARNFGQPVQHADDGEATRVFTAARPAVEPERIGTPAYMAPEQFRGGPLDARTDIWAAGVVLYHLLTRENPFKGDPDTIEMKVQNAEPTPPSQLSVIANRAFDDLVKKALAKRPEDRFQDARAFTAALLEATRRRAGGSGNRAGAAETTISAPTPPPAPPSPASPPWMKFAAAGGGVAVLAGLAAFLLMPGAPPPPAPPAPAQLVQPAPPTRSEAPAPLALAPAATPTPMPAPMPSPAPPTAMPSPAPAQPAAPVPQPLLVPAQPFVAPSPAAPLLVPAQPSAPASPAPAPAPAVVAAPAMPSEAAIQAALASAADRQRCALADLRRDGNLVTISGFVHQSAAEGLQAPLRAAGLTPRLQAEIFDGPFCGILAALRPATAWQPTPRVAARTTHLRGGERLTLDFDMPNWPAVVNLWFVMHDGTTLQLLANQRMAANERRMMNQTSPDFPWVIGEPYGHEMVIMLASEAPPFATPRPLEETIDSLTTALGGAIRSAAAEGRRLVGQAVMVHTRP